MGEFIRNGPGETPLDFTGAQKAPLGFTGAVRHTDKGAFVETPIIGACTRCNTASSVAVPVGMSFKIGDKLMDGKITKVLCPMCRRETEFRPLSPKELSEDQFFIMRRFYDIYKQEVVDGKELPPNIKEFIDAYDERLKSARMMREIGQKKAAPEGPPRFSTG